MGRTFPLPLWFLVVLSACSRGTPGVTEPEIDIVGFRIEATLTDQLMKPLGDVEVRLFYELDFADGDSIDRSFTPPDTNAIVSVQVRTLADSVVRDLFNGKPPAGSPLVVPWNGKDNSGTDVRSGIYIVTFSITGQVQKAYAQIRDGNMNAVSDSLGRFVIPESDLPVDSVASLYDSKDEFIGQYRLVDRVILRLATPTFTRDIEVSLLRNKITKFTAVLS